MAGNTFVQVTSRSVRLVDSMCFGLLHEFVAPRSITVASGTATQVTLALVGGELLYLELDAKAQRFTQQASAQLDQDVACVSLRPVQGASTATANAAAAAAAEGASEAMDVDADAEGSAAAVSTPKPADRASLLAVAMWTDNSVRLLALPTMQEICRVQLGTDTQARDVLLVDLGGKTYLLVGLGDGRLVTFNVDFAGDLPALVNKRNGVVGTHPITFNYFENAGAACVFVACDRPTVIHSKNGKLLFSVLDANQVEFTNMTPFHSELFPGCIALSSEAALVIGVIEDVQKVHVQKVPLNQAPRRITHSSQNALYAGEFIFVWLMPFIYSIFY
jgi:DNA damage-binding protein 1